MAALAFALVGCGSGASDEHAAVATWPKRVTLHASFAAEGNGIRLSDGVEVTGPGDLKLGIAMVMSLRSPADESCCAKGKYGSLAEVPTDEGDCPAMLGSSWARLIYLTGSSIHTNEQSTVIGLGALVRDASGQSLYRLRILGDSYDAQTMATATFEYEPVP